MLESMDFDSDKDSPRKRLRTESPDPVPKNLFSAVPSRIKPVSRSAAKPHSKPSPAENSVENLAHDDDSARVDGPGFEGLGVSRGLVRALDNMAIRTPTPIQSGCIPEILKGRDCIGGSRTGSGKTVAFAIPILQKLAQDPSAIFSLILTPTRYDFVLAVSSLIFTR